MSSNFRRTLVLLTGCALALTGSAAPALAQANIAVQYGFQDAGGTGTTVPTINNSTVTLDATAASTLGGTAAAFAAVAGSTDPAATNQVWEITNFPAGGAGNLTAGVQFRLPTAAAAGGFTNLILRFDHQHDATASRFFQAQYTTDGTNYVSAGTYEGFLPGTFFTRTFDLSGVTAANNNTNFAVRLLAQFAPGTNDYAPTNPAATYAPAGPQRFDMVTVQRGLRWQGGSGQDLGTAGNWQGGAAPGVTDAVLFGTSANTTVNVAAAQSLGPVIFQAGAPAYTFSGGQALTITGGITNNSTNRQTISAPMTFQGSQSIQNSGTLVFGGNWTVPAGQQVRITGGGTTVINGTVAGGQVSFGNGQTLAGIGTFNFEPHIFNGKLRGGFSDGTNNFGTLTVSGDLETYAMPGNLGTVIQVETQRTGPNAANFSKIMLIGGGGSDLELNGANTGNNLWGIEILGSNLAAGETYTVQVVTVPAGGIEENGAVRGNDYIFSPTTYNLTSPNLPGFSSQQLRVVSDLVSPGNDTLVLTFTPIPEPAGLFAMCAAAMAGGAWLRRRASADNVRGRAVK